MTFQAPDARRVRPPSDHVTEQIIKEAAGPATPLVAPDIPVPIDPGPVFGVALRAEDEREDEREDEPQDVVVDLSAGIVAALQAVHRYPCVSLLLTTRPGESPHPDDLRRLEGLRQDALRRLRAEGLVGNGSGPDGEALAAGLRRAVRAVGRQSADRGLAVLVSADTCRAVRLPVEVNERVVVDPTFATRDLVRALHRTPRHVVLVLSARRAALLDGASGRLAPVTGTAFPLAAGGGPEWLDRVDLALGSYLRLRPAPLLVAGPQDVVTAFCARSVNLGRLAGTLYAPAEDLPPGELARRTAPVLRRYLASREAAAAELLEQRRAQGRVAAGVRDAWRTARSRPPEMLLVEEGFRYPARLSPDGEVPTQASDVEAPDVIDDLVDELIELVLERGGWVALAQDDALAQDGRVVLTTR